MSDIQAIALSLQDSREVSGAGAVHTDVQDATFTERKGNARLKRKKLVCFVSELLCRFQGLHYLALLPLNLNSLGFLFICGLQFTSRVQMTEDEMIVHFFQFDGNF